MLYRDKSGQPTLAFVVYPLLLGGASIIASVIGSLFVRLGKSTWIMGALYKGLLAAVVVALPLFYGITYLFASNGEFAKATNTAFAFPVYNLFWCGVI